MKAETLCSVENIINPESNRNRFTSTPAQKHDTKGHLVAIPVKLCSWKRICNLEGDKIDLIFKPQMREVGKSSKNILITIDPDLIEQFETGKTYVISVFKP